MLRSRQGKECKTCSGPGAQVIVPPDEQAGHDNSDEHRRNVFLGLLAAQEREFIKDKEGIRMICTNTGETGHIIRVKGYQKDFLDINIEIHSDDFDVSFKRALILRPNQTVKVLNPVGDNPVNIKKGSTFTLTLRAHSDQQYHGVTHLAFMFSRRNVSHIYIFRYIEVTIDDPSIQSLMPEGEYKAVEPVAQLPDAGKIVRMKMSETRAFSRVREARMSRLPEDYVPGNDEEAEDVFVQTETVRRVPLHLYQPALTLKQMHLKNLTVSDDDSEAYKSHHEDVRECLKTAIDSKKPENYGHFFKYLLAFEDIQQEADIRMYDKESAELTPYDDEDLERFIIDVEGLEEGRPSLLRFDKIYVRQDHSIEYEGYIDKVRSNSIEIIMNAEFLKVFYESEDYLDEEDHEEEYEDINRFVRKETKVRYGVRFTVSRKTMRLMYRSLNQYLDVVGKSTIDRLLMPRMQWPAGPTTSNLDIKLVNQSIADNPEQLCAVRNIVLGLHRPLAYVLFGPPGTGKTTTITEAIIQVYKTLPESRILVVAPSNSAANVVTEKILRSNAVQRSDIFRLCGITNSEQRVSAEIREVSNWKSYLQQFEEVSMETIMQYRIVACTLTMSGVIVTTGVRRGFFTHIFIDEAGHAMEPEALIPLTGLLEPYDGRGLGGSVILSGDHKQLGPIIRSPIAKSHGMVQSFLERIMETKPYRKKENGAYNPMVLTKLVRNFRSHPKILEVPNGLFYDGELQAFGDKKVTHSMIMYEKLPTKSFPIIFHGVFGREMRELSNPSFFNPDEIKVIITYVRHLLAEGTKTFDDEPIQQKDIGIIAPYRKQVLKLRAFLRQQGYTDITVGSTEEFQGQERLIMIISTVRCHSPKVFETNPGQSLGFLRNRKRFNVAVTRAKALMIIVGDPRVLEGDFCWRKLLSKCREDNCLTGETYESNKKQYSDLFAQLEALEISLKGVKLGCGGQITITDLALQEEPQWRDDE